MPSGADHSAMLDDLRVLCAGPTVAGQTRALEDGVGAVMDLLRSNGLQVQLYATGGAPIVVARYDAGRPRTLLIYGRYDVAPPGPRRAWRGDPFQPIMRDDRLWARGAVAKGELVARVAAVRRLIEGSALPCNVLFVVEGESLLGSPHLQAVAPLAASAHWALWTGGACDAAGLPLLYTGVKGLLQVELRADGPRLSLPAGFAATAPNPLWSLVAALGHIKSSFEEVTIEGFYDEVVAPDKETMAGVRGLDVGETARRAAWGVDRFVANLQGPMLARAESFSPSCNLSAIDYTGNESAIPSRATAQIQFQLVPDQQPDTVFALLRAHLAAHRLTNITATRLPGSYAPRAAGGCLNAATEAAAAVYGGEPRVVGMAPFSSPASLIVPPGTPLLACGLDRPDSAVFGPDESVPLRDLAAHANFLRSLIGAVAS